MDHAEVLNRLISNSCANRVLDPGDRYNGRIGEITLHTIELHCAIFQVKAKLLQKLFIQTEGDNWEFDYAQYEILEFNAVKR